MDHKILTILNSFILTKNNFSKLLFPFLISFFIVKHKYLLRHYFYLSIVFIISIISINSCFLSSISTKNNHITSYFSFWPWNTKLIRRVGQFVFSCTIWVQSLMMADYSVTALPKTTLPTSPGNKTKVYDPMIWVVLPTPEPHATERSRISIGFLSGS